MGNKKKAEIWNAGFDAGISYAFSHMSIDKFTKEELIKFADWIELKCPWHDFSEWYELILRGYGLEE